MSVPLLTLNDGVKIPVVGVGTFLMEGEICTHSVKLALELGYRHIDTAEQYENQTYIKEGIKGFPREDLFITSKLKWDFLDPKVVEQRVDLCLKELGVDYLDLYLIHWPNLNTPIAEIVEEMIRLKEKGKIRSVGVSNFTINHLKNLLKKGLKVAVNQVEFHPYLNQHELLKFCKFHEIAITAYSPLAHGEVLDDPVLKTISLTYKKTVAQICLKWLLQKKMVVIPMANTEDFLLQNLNLFDFEISDADMLKIDGLNKNHRTMEPSIHEFNY